MISTLTAARAQVSAELRERFRAPATVLTLLAALVLSFLWLPDPSGRVTSISWSDASGARTTCQYNTAYLGAAVGILVSLFLSLIGFYLVAGSIRRDREKGIGAILAATPLSDESFLLGKAAAHFVYLVSVGGLALLSGVAVFLRFGTGAFSLWQFVMPFLTLAVPSLAMAAACAVLFDVTPGLRGRGGYVIWFFAWSFILIALPMMAPLPAIDGFSAFDPMGCETFVRLLAKTVPGVQVDSISIGLEFFDAPPRRVLWDGFGLTPGFVAARLLTGVWVALILLFSYRLFDRFDPARRRGAERSRPSLTPLPEVTGAAPEQRGSRGISWSEAGRVAGVRPRPQWWRAVEAEARLTWDSSPRFRWVLAAAACGSALLPHDAVRFGAAATLLLLGILLSEMAAREELCATGPLIFSQPSLSSSIVLWKGAAASLVSLAALLPSILRLSFGSPTQALALLTGALFVSAFAVAAGYMSGGGKLFSALHTALWYLMIQGSPGTDYAGVGAATVPSISVPLAYLLGGIMLMLAAAVVERRRTGR